MPISIDEPGSWTGHQTSWRSYFAVGLFSIVTLVLAETLWYIAQSLAKVPVISSLFGVIMFGICYGAAGYLS